VGRIAVLGAIVGSFLAVASVAHAGVVVRPRFGHVVLRNAPHGRVVARLGRRTEFGSPLVYSVRARRGRWIAVITPQRPNGRFSWIDVRTLRIARESLRIDVSLSRRMLSVRRGDAVVARVRVGIGSPASPTPTGMFAVTDRLPGADFSTAAYGCCILALAGHQPHPPATWRGSDTLLAIHGGPFGAVSNGCLHASEPALRFLMKHVPLGTRVTIRA
jgi:lipoprotein-anchoring transpeptidase ErfK/SrfK